MLNAHHRRHRRQQYNFDLTHPIQEAFVPAGSTTESHPAVSEGNHANSEADTIYGIKEITYTAKFSRHTSK